MKLKKLHETRSMHVDFVFASLSLLNSDFGPLTTAHAAVNYGSRSRWRLKFSTFNSDRLKILTETSERVEKPLVNRCPPLDSELWCAPDLQIFILAPAFDSTDLDHS